MFQVMYHMHWTLEDIQKLTPRQYNWVVESLKRQKKREARAVKKGRRRR